MALDFEVLKKDLGPHLEHLKNLHFSYLNPLLWGILFIIFVVTSWFWGIKKAFGFALVAGAVLLLTTQTELLVARNVVRSGETFDPTMIRIIASFILLIVILYYAMIKNE